MHTLLRGTLLALALLALPAAGVHATDAATIARQGNGKSAPCMACHGRDGGGQEQAAYPRLAGLNAAYLLKQLDDFANGTRDNAVMKAVATALTPDERKAIAAYYSAMPVPPSARHSGVTPPPANSLGATLALRGRWDQQVPGCVQCHGPHGVGVGAHFPPLAGQPAAYLAAQLKDWKKGSRHNDPLDLMQHVSTALDAKDIQAVSAWFAAQPLNAKGATP